VNSLPKTVTRQRRGCDLNPGPSAPEYSTLTTRLPSHPEMPKCDAKSLLSMGIEGSMVPWVLASEYSTQHLDCPFPILHILLTMANNSTFAPPYSLACTSATVRLKKRVQLYFYE